MESIYENSVSNFSDFDNIFARVEMDIVAGKRDDLLQSVKMSIDSEKSENLDMSPFMW